MLAALVVSALLWLAVLVAMLSTACPKEPEITSRTSERMSSISRPDP